MDINIVLYDRPTEPGFSWVTVDMPGRMNYAQASNYFTEWLKAFTPPDGGEFGTLHYQDIPNQGQGGLVSVLWPQDADSVFAESNVGEILEWRPGIIALLGYNGVVDAIGFYVRNLDHAPVPQGLIDVKETYLDQRGNIIKEVDSQGNVWTPDSSAQGLGLGFIATLMIAGLVSLLALAIASGLGLSNNPVVSAFVKPIKAGSDALVKVFDKAGRTGAEVVGTAGDIGKGLLWLGGFVGGIKLLKWGMSK